LHGVVERRHTTRHGGLGEKQKGQKENNQLLLVGVKALLQRIVCA